MKDIANFKVDGERISVIKQRFNEGASAAQAAFAMLIAYIVEVLDAHRPSEGEKAPNGLITKLRQEFEVCGLKEKGNLSSSYTTVSLTLASAIHRNALTTPLEHVWANFEDVGEGLDGSKVDGPLYNPGRLNAAWGALARTDESKSPFEVTGEGILGNGTPWHQLRIKDLKDLNSRGTTTPKVVDSIKRVLGDPEDFEKKPGSLMKLASVLRTENESMQSEAIGDLCSTIEGFIEEQRDDIGVVLAVEDRAAAEAKVMEAEQRRLERRQNAGSAREGAAILNDDEFVEDPEETEEVTG
jgi:hypothetical protein